MSVHTSPQFGSVPVAGLDGPPLLVLGTDWGRRREAVSLAENVGQSTVDFDADDLSAIHDRLADQMSARGVWLTLTSSANLAALDSLVTTLDALAAERGWPIVIEAPSALIDPLAAKVTDPGVALLIDGGEPERVAAMAILLSRVSRHASVQDITTEPSSARLRQLSDEVSRIAATLARLSAGPPPATTVEKPVEASGAALPPLSGETVRSVIRARRLRGRYFEEELFADPAWDMLLDLLRAEIAQHRVPVSSLCIAAAVPATTALRWIKTMTDAGLFVRRADPHDGRRVFVELAPQASEGLRMFFAEVGKVAVI